MVDKKILIKEFIQKNPSLNASDTLRELQLLGLGMRKTNFLKLFRETRKLPEPTIAKREKSIPIKFRPTKRKPSVKKPSIKKPSIKKPTKQLKLPVKIEFKDTKFGKITKSVQDKHKISEANAIVRARALLKIPRMDFDKLNEIDKDILIQFGY